MTATERPTSWTCADWEDVIPHNLDGEALYGESDQYCGFRGRDRQYCACPGTADTGYGRKSYPAPGQKWAVDLSSGSGRAARCRGPGSITRRRIRILKASGSD